MYKHDLSQMSCVLMTFILPAAAVKTLKKRIILRCLIILGDDHRPKGAYGRYEDTNENVKYVIEQSLDHIYQYIYVYMYV